MSTVFADLVERYLRTPGADTLQAVHEQIAAGGNYDPELPLEQIAAPYLRNGEYDELATRLLDLMPGAMLSPSTHTLLADAYEHTGEQRAAGRERTLARMATRAILRSGDGTVERPWSVLRVSDETDALGELGRTSHHVRYDERDGRLVDLHRCDDGSEVWFDVTLLREPVTAGSPSR
ncbi:MAG TPA: DUF4919 domain-containing protein [Nocardioides sp.]|nr:DUF4919 domain-containing protein [Nocardioides sp.]